MNQILAKTSLAVVFTSKSESLVMETIYFLIASLMDPLSYLAAISLKAFMATSRILGTWDPVVLKILFRHFSTYFYPRWERAIYFKE